LDNVAENFVIEKYIDNGLRVSESSVQRDRICESAQSQKIVTQKHRVAAKPGTDSRTISRLTGEMFKVLQADNSNPEGQRKSLMEKQSGHVKLNYIPMTSL